MKNPLDYVTWYVVLNVNTFIFFPFCKGGGKGLSDPHNHPHRIYCPE